MKFLVFQHVEHQHPGLLTSFAKEHFIELEIVEFWNLYTIPDAGAYKALIILGGPMDVDDPITNFPSRNDEISYIKNNMGKLPMLGFCLGAQLLAHALGAAVYPNVRNGKLQKELGYYETTLTENGQNSPIFKGYNQKFTTLQWHSDTFDLPNGAELLASTETCTNQAFSYQNVFGIQFHSEYTPDMVARQIEIDKNYIHENFAFDEESVLKYSRDFADSQKDMNYKLMMNFLSIIS